VLFPVRLFFRRNDEALRVETLRITQTKSLEMSSRTTIQRTISLRIAIFIGAKISLKSSELNRFSTRFSTKNRNKIGCKVSFARISEFAFLRTRGCRNTPVAPSGVPLSAAQVQRVT
jgi:ribosomal protein L5